MTVNYMAASQHIPHVLDGQKQSNIFSYPMNSGVVRGLRFVFGAEDRFYDWRHPEGGSCQFLPTNSHPTIRECPAYRLELPGTGKEPPLPFRLAPDLESRHFKTREALFPVFSRFDRNRCFRIAFRESEFFSFLMLAGRIIKTPPLKYLLASPSCRKLPRLAGKLQGCRIHCSPEFAIFHATEVPVPYNTPFNTFQ